MKIIKIFFIAISLLFFETIAVAQVSKGKKYLAKREYELAIEAFENDLEKPLNIPFSLEALGNIYFDKSYKEYDLFKAYKYYQRAVDEYKKLSSKDKRKLQNKGFSRLAISKKMKDIADLEMRTVEKNKAVLMANTYLEHYQDIIDTRQRKKVNQWRNQWALDAAQKVNTYEVHVNVLKNYEVSFMEYTPELYKQLQQALLETYIAENGWMKYPNFEEEYPDHIYVKEDEAAYALIRLYRKRSLETMKEYIRAYPNSLFVKFAKDYLYELTIKQDKLEAYDYFLRTYPNYEDNNTMWEEFYQQYIAKKGQLAVIDFAQQYPEYPLKEKLEKDLNVAQGLRQKPLYEAAVASGKSAQMYSFLINFPRSAYRDDMEKPFYQALLKNGTFRGYEYFLKAYPKSTYYNEILELMYQEYTKDGEWASINQFMVDYPAYGNTEQLKKDLELAEQGAYLALAGPYTSKYKGNYEDYIRKAAPKERAFVALQRLIEADIAAQNWSLAIAKLDKFESYFGDDPKYKQLRALLSDKWVEITKKPLGEALNTTSDEYVPIITVDDKQLYFCRWDNTNENIYVATKQNGKWATVDYVQGINIDAPGENEGALSVSADNNEMMVFKNADLYMATRTAEGWMAPTPLSRTINTNAWEADAMIASDGKTLLFTSGRPESLHLQVGDVKGFHGSGSQNIDLYVSFKNEMGEWQAPINLGHHINTPFIERTPFLHPDMKTLYFSSDGHGGLGRMDVYKTTRLDDSWTNWTKPINLGKSINTPQNDWGYKVSTDGQTAYFAFQKEAKQGQDLYQIDLPKYMQPEQVSIISGTLTDQGGNPLFAEIIWEDLETGKEVGRLKSDPENGQFYITLPKDKKYSYYIEKEGYFPKSNNIDLMNNDQPIKLEETLSLIKIEEMIANEEAVQLKNLFFDPNEYVLKKASYLELNRLAKLIKKYNLKIQIEGHTDNNGKDEANLLLSQNRANAVKEYLVEQGFDAASITAKGYGEKKPVADNKTALGRQLNRRVEVLFFK